MAGFTLSDVVEGMKTTLEETVAREMTVLAYPLATPPPDTITIEVDWIDYWTTATSAGYGTVHLTVRVTPAGKDFASRVMALYDFLSVGTGNTSSIVDAVLDNRTLGLAGCTVGLAPQRDMSVTIEPTSDTVEAAIPFDVVLKKIGAAA